MQDDDKDRQDHWITKPIPKVIRGWATFLALVAFSGGVWSQQPQLAPVDAAAIQFFFCGIAWFLGGYFMDERSE
ncbi:hypothetical protein [Parvibaculum sp.]|uniref:hypothetical protein n=1 Tax=Parvibaculum sp. TaxID=2024848 RepID=UPI000C934392|nr:hypothetical protein [Parvibaculum sp.]MAB12523.1 hypothetical protein [Parvibaculum sp.]